MQFQFLNQQRKYSRVAKKLKTFKSLLEISEYKQQVSEEHVKNAVDFDYMNTLIFMNHMYMFSANQSSMLLIPGRRKAYICMVLAFSSYSADFIPVLATMAFEIQEKSDFVKPKGAC